MPEDISPRDETVRYMHIFSELPEEYRSVDAGHFRMAVAQDETALQQIGPVISHKEIAARLDELIGMVRKVMAASELGKQIIQDYALDADGLELITGFPVIINSPQKQQPWLRVQVDDEGEWEFLNLRTGHCIALHSALITLIGDFGFYGAHDERSSPQDITHTLELRPSSLPDDDPITLAIASRERGEQRLITIRTFDQMQRYKNIEPFLGQGTRGNYLVRPATLADARLIQEHYQVGYFVDVLAFARGTEVLSNLPERKNGGSL